MAVDPKELRALIQQFRESLNEAEYKLHALQRKFEQESAVQEAEIEKYTLAVRGLEAVTGDTPEKPDEAPSEETGPEPNPFIVDAQHKVRRGKAAVEAILKSEHGRAFTPAQLADELTKRGWVDPNAADPAAAARSAANRLRAADDAYVFENGTYSYRPLPASPFKSSDGAYHLLERSD